MGARLSSFRKPAMTSSDWLAFMDARGCLDIYPDTAACEAAAARLAAGDVLPDTYSDEGHYRVRCSHTRGDRRVRGWNNYYPERGCRCHYARTHGSAEDYPCAHLLAVMVMHQHDDEGVL